VSLSRKDCGHLMDSRDMWHLCQGIYTIIDYKPTPQVCSSDPYLPDALNDYFGRWYLHASKLPRSSRCQSNRPCPVSTTVALTPTHHDILQQIDIEAHESKAQKATGPTLACFLQKPATDVTVATSLHLSLFHLYKKDTHVKMLFINFSSPFNTVIPQKLVRKLNLLA